MLARGNVNRVYRIIRFNCDKRAFVQHTKKCLKLNVMFLLCGRAMPAPTKERKSNIYTLYIVYNLD